MAKRLVYHVLRHRVPRRLTGPQRYFWAMVSQNRIVLRSETKAPVEAAARALAKDHGFAQVVVHGANGKIQTEYTYGSDPRRRKG